MNTIRIYIKKILDWYTQTSKYAMLKNLSLVFIGIIIAYILFFISDSRSGKTYIQPQSTNNPSENIQRYNWREEIKSIEKLIGDKFLDVNTRQSGPIDVFNTADITGDKTDEALISLGSGGAYTEFVTLAKINFTNKDGSLGKTSKPVIAQFKQKDGHVSPLMFAIGSSVSNGEAVELVPTTRSLYSGSWSIDEANPDTVQCELDVYVWNPGSGLFEYNKSMSESSLLSFCAKVSTN